jgi:hypothetical protein
LIRAAIHPTCDHVSVDKDFAGAFSAA